MKTRVAVVGAGDWGKNLVRNFHELDALGAICEVNQQRAKQLGQKYPGVAIYQDLAEVLEDDEIQAVAVATPAVTHFEIARAALEAGKDVFVEKPLSVDVREGEELVSLASSLDRILMVGHILRYHPAVVTLLDLVDSGQLGRIQYLYSNRLNIGKIRTEENILWSFAPHDVSVVLALLGEMPVEIVARGSTHLGSGLFDVTMSQLLFPSGVEAHIFVSWLHPFKEQRLVVVGSEKMAVFDDTTQHKLVVYPHRVEWRNRMPKAVRAEAEIVPLAPTEPLRAECEHFIDKVSQHHAPITDGSEGLRVLRVLDACQRSLEQGGRPVELGSGGRPSRSADLHHFVHDSACVDDGAVVGEGTKVWHFSHVMTGARIGRNCTLGQNVNVDGGVEIGDNVKIQNNVSIYTGTIVEDDVFLGPSCVLTNIPNPRSQVDRRSLYERTVLRRGCTIGANATIVCPVSVGRYGFVAAGSVVTGDVPDYGLVMGNPARLKGWMSRHGHRLPDPDVSGNMVCPESGFRYREVSPMTVQCLDLDEESPLPKEHEKGSMPFREFRKKRGNRG